jgi:protein TonB
VPVITPSVEAPLITLTEEPPPNAITVAVAEAPPPAPEPAAPRIVSDVAYVEPPQPRYPPESRRSGEEGLVVLRVLINEMGRAARVDIERSSGHRRLDEAARLAVQRALFRPYVENGVARMALATIPIEFSWKARRG